MYLKFCSYERQLNAQRGDGRMDIMGNKSLSLIKSGEFLGTKCDFYKDSDDNVYMTRMQIGKALQYKNPDDGIYRIHKRNKDRLDDFSVVVKLSSTDGKQYDTRLYIEKGIYDICRFSRQPIADQFCDWVYEELALIRRTGGTITLVREKEFLDAYFPSLTEEAKLKMVEDLRADLERQRKEIEEWQPKSNNWEAYMDARGNVTMAKLAKSLNIKGIGRNNLFKLLRQKEILRSPSNEPYQRYVDSGYFEVVHTEKNGRKFSQTLVTGKGMEWINKKMHDWGYFSEE